eukprot:3302790-Prymnesium_polylepis.2
MDEHARPEDQGEQVKRRPDAKVSSRSILPDPCLPLSLGAVTLCTAGERATGRGAHQIVETGRGVRQIGRGRLADRNRLNCDVPRVRCAIAGRGRWWRYIR